MDVGQALRRAEEIAAGWGENPGEEIGGWGDEDELEITPQRAHLEFLNRPFSWFLSLTHDDQFAYIGDYVARTRELWFDRQDLIDEEADLLVENLTTRVVGEKEKAPAKAAKSGDGFKRSGDKWVSPGRLICEWSKQAGSLSVRDLAVAFVMASHGDNQGQDIFIAQGTIAEILGYNRTTVIRAQKALEDAGVFTVTKPATQHYTAQWRLNKPKGKP